MSKYDALINNFIKAEDKILAPPTVPESKKAQEKLEKRKELLEALIEDAKELEPPRDLGVVTEVDLEILIDTRFDDLPEEVRERIWHRVNRPVSKNLGVEKK